MKLEDQVCSLELSVKLFTLGVKQNSLHRWQHVLRDLWEPTSLKKKYIEENNSYPENYSAFTVSELGEMLPTKFLWKNNDGTESCENVYLHIKKLPNSYQIWYADDDDKWFHWMEFSYVTEADARAKMLVYLIENKIIEI